MKLNILTGKVWWFGKYSGYQCLTDYFPDNIKITLSYPKDFFFNKLIGGIIKRIKGWPDLQSNVMFSEVLFISRIRKNDISHILYLEDTWHGLELINCSNKVLGTIHIPITFWRKENLLRLRNLKGVIILYESEINKFSEYIDNERIHFIHHGVDIDFFKPGKLNIVNRNKILFVGFFLRNFKMFLEVYNSISSELRSELEFHFIIPKSFRNISQELIEIQSLSNTYFHENLSDEELLDYYQQSYLLFMPMEDSGANTAIVQALATGLPILTTNVGGINSYGGGDVFPVVDNNDNIAMLNLFKKYITDIDFRNQISENQRKFAKDVLDWKIISKKHLDLYSKVRQ